jgi:hypothetical protein
VRRGVAAILALSGCFVDNPAWLGSTDGSSGGESGGTDPVLPGCEPLPPPPSGAVVVAPGELILAAIAEAGEGGTVLLADGAYALDTASLVIDIAGITLRSQSGNAAAVVLDGGASSAPLVIVRAPDVTIAEVTFTGGLETVLQIDPSGPAGASGVSVVGVTFVDAGVNTLEAIAGSGGSAYAEEGVVECSTFRRTALLTDLARCPRDTALVVHGGRGWIIRANLFQRHGCRSAGAATLEVGDGARDTTISYNRFLDCNRALLIGGEMTGNERAWPDATCTGSPPWAHIGGLVANNVAWVGDPQIDPDSMFSAWSACDARIYHNTAAMVGNGFNGVEYRFANTDARVFNNLSTHPIAARDGALGQAQANLQVTDPNDFVNLLAGDVHLAASSSAIGQALQPLDVEVGADIDGDARDGEPDIGADEYLAP